MQGKQPVDPRAVGADRTARRSARWCGSPRSTAADRDRAPARHPRRRAVRPFEPGCPTRQRKIWPIRSSKASALGHIEERDLAQGAQRRVAEGQPVVVHDREPRGFDRRDALGGHAPTREGELSNELGAVGLDCDPELRPAFAGRSEPVEASSGETGLSWGRSIMPRAYLRWRPETSAPRQRCSSYTTNHRSRVPVAARLLEGPEEAHRPRRRRRMRARRSRSWRSR